MSRDLMPTADIKNLVRDAYRHVPLTSAAVAHRLYSVEERALVPRSAIDRALGVANHLPHATLRSGDTVLDRGCGGGGDSILAVYPPGSAGGVIALDFLPEMLTRTADAWAGVGLSNVEPLEGELEAIPLPGDSGLIISNGVINLSAPETRCGNHGSPA
jgi:arsenite methyltransferase